MTAFIKKSELSLLNGGYLMSNNQPVTNNEFVKAQRKVHFYNKLAENVVGKNFKNNPIESFESIYAKTLAEINSTKKIELVKKVNVEMPLGDELIKEAKSWEESQVYNNKADKINTIITEEFSSIVDFEEFGLFFESGIVKLERIYTIEEIANYLSIIVDFI
jgi:hypothetical protein